MKLAIVGSSDLTFYQAAEVRHIIEGALDHLIEKDYFVTVVSGASPKGGVDIIAEEVANKKGIPTLIFRPEINQWHDKDGKMGYKSRNKRIAQECDVMICIRSEQSKTYGSGWTADHAEKLGKKVERLTV